MSDGALNMQLVTVGVDAARKAIHEWVESEHDAEMREAIAPELWEIIQASMRSGEHAGEEHERWMQMCEGASMAIDAWVRTGSIPELDAVHE